MKSPRTVFTEGALYVVIAMGSPLADYFTSDRAINTRSVVAVCIVACVAGANALKAFLSQSVSNLQPTDPKP